ncbi:MAG: ABC transporter [Sphingobacteriia bacterium 24-36-13]|uniref:ABC transporter ATP-binding protein n=1 Tax=Sediminibacterium sp. TaxID=1917865 RepID=UPI000BD0D008|nr:ABC transporter ATP-binding protein [Sediminibacterium sp.]OYY11043.1 MAG: ABC transporter [Sphingobacteriia bacterium 35-36-14]OYZ54699.1 MAG: ABC transporter [Sphingobacteriia bacterium 24-36-13]OZA63435.1 MAG: ABC transporter [Sphingobacteriia bacterium 39-36-14]HQS23388.1 ABC transporter ATP-binding protein [Sediminibacterium sp.]HQS34851.1 ABC transporter ATP-binding protein [Sediminibacterium sp.]
MKELASLNHYFWKYRKRFFIGIFFVIASNYFAVLAPQITGYVISLVQQRLPGAKPGVPYNAHDGIVNSFIKLINGNEFSFGWLIAICSLSILFIAIVRGILMFFMRQTIIVMSRHIEFDQKNQVFDQYQRLNTSFYKQNSTGDLMNRISEDVSRVRMYTGPAVMYLINLVTLIGFCIVNMLSKDVNLTLLVLAPLPLLAITIYKVNSIINKKSESIQEHLSNLTTNAQESYSGIRVIKSFVQEKAMLGFFNHNSEQYKANAISLAKVEALYFPSMALMIGISTLITIFVGGMQAMEDPTKVGTIVEFVIYINMLTFPVSAIGWTASMIQRAAASQKRLNEFLQIEPAIQDHPTVLEDEPVSGTIEFKNVSFTYPHTGIKAIQRLNLSVARGEKVLILGKTGSGKSTLAQLLLRFYEPDQGSITIGSKPLQLYSLNQLRQNISYVQQDVFLFSDTVANNIRFGVSEHTTIERVIEAAKSASIHEEIMGFENGYETLIGERGVTLSGGQKQRISIARALIKAPEIVLFDDCLSAVDAKTEKHIIDHLYEYLKAKTALIVTHRIFAGFKFDQIIVLEDGIIIEQGTHEELMNLNGYYAELYKLQLQTNKEA